ncbi:MAG: PDZ domain-containing protein [Planctomycetota bacterium]
MINRVFPILLVVGATLFAGGKTVEELIADLGHETYEVREAATKELIAKGAAAVPALEKAITSEDVEVRMRAGRALRSIRDAAKPKKPVPQPKRDARGNPGWRGSVDSVSIQQMNGETIVTLRSRGEDGKPTTKTYKGKSLDEIKEKHPEVKKALGGMKFQFDMGGVGSDRWKEFEKRWFEEDDFWKRSNDDLNKEIERLREWAQRLAEQQRRHRAPNMESRRGRADAMQLGVRARRPEAVLDVQLQLRGRGLVIEEVARGSRAEKAGLQRYDILVELNGMAIRGLQDVGPALRAAKDATLTAKVVRRGQITDLKSDGQSVR